MSDNPIIRAPSHAPDLTVTCILEDGTVAPEAGSVLVEKHDENIEEYSWGIIGSCYYSALVTENKGYRFLRYEWDENGKHYTSEEKYLYDDFRWSYYEEKPSGPIEESITENAKAVFRKIALVSVTTESSPANGGVTIGDGDYYEGDECSVTAMPKPGFAFTEWEIRRKLATGYTVIYRSNESGFTFTVPPMEEGRPNEVVCVAFFVEDLIKITTKANPVAGGKTTGDGKYAPGEECTITATANQGYKFREWVSSLGNRSNEAVHTFVVGDSDEIWTGYFEETGGYVITVVANPKEGGKPEGGGTYGEGAGCTIAANPDMRYDFLYWKVDGSDEPVSTEEEYTFSVTRDAVYTAYYQKRTGPWMYYTKVI